MEDELHEGCDVSNDGPLNKSMFHKSALHGVVRNFTVGKNPIKLSAEGRTFAHGMRVIYCASGQHHRGITLHVLRKKFGLAARSSS